MKSSTLMGWGMAWKRNTTHCLHWRHTEIYPRKYREDASTTILIDEYEDLNDLKEQILEFLPKSVYYDRNIYDKEGVVLGQEIAFDLILTKVPRMAGAIV